MKIITNGRNIDIIEKEKLYTGNIKTYMIDIEFEESNRFLEYSCYVTFKNGDIKKKVIVGPNQKIHIPSEVLENVGDLVIGFFAIREDNEQNLIRYSSDIYVLPVQYGGYDKEATYTEEISPSILEQYLQEMRKFYIESLEEYNSNAKNKLESYNTNADNKLKEYNDNASQKLTEYNNNSDNRIKEYDGNAKLKKEEIEKISKEVSKNKTDIEEIEKRVKTSESNAKTSETNASTSEQNAQNSLNKVTEIETNVTSIQEEINQTKEEMDTAKTSIDNSVIEVNGAVVEATNQANESKKQADIATSMASQTSTNKTAVENMMNEVSKMKTSVEQTKTATEKIKTDTQAIYNDTVTAKNETLEAKTEVETSLETERAESDKKYARAIETDEMVIDGSGQVELDEDGFMKDVSIESNLDITQEKREGYNLINLNKQFPYTSHGVTVDKKSDGRIVLNGTADANFNISFSEYFEISNLVGKNLTLSVKTTGIGKINNIGLKRYYAENVLVLNNIENDITKSTSVENFNPEYTNATGVAAWVLAETVFENFTIYLSLVEGTEEKPYEPYGAMPSLDYPSEFKNIVKNVDIQNNQKNFLDMSNAKGGSSYGVNVIVNSNGTYSYIGTATNPAINVWLLGGFDRYIPIFVLKAGTYYCKDVRIFSGPNTLIAENEDKTLKEDTPITGVRAAQAVTGQTYNEIKYPMITRIEDKDMPYEQYKGQKEQITLSEGQFIGNFNGYKNYIGSNKLKRRLKILTLTGEENWQLNTTKEKTQVFLWYLGRDMANNIGICSHLKFNAPGDSEKCTVYNRGVYLAINKTTASTVEEIKALLAQKYQEGNPVKVLYVTTEEFEEDLSIENKSKINNFKIYKGTNNIYSNCKIKFKANKNLQTEIEKCVKKEDYAAYNKFGIVRGANGLNFSNGVPYAKTLTKEEFDSADNANFIGKGTLEKVLSAERENNNRKYSKALKGIVENKQVAQIYAENKNVDNLVIKGNEITQKTRTGYNRLDTAKLVLGNANGITKSKLENGKIKLSGTTTDKISNCWLTNLNETLEPGTYTFHTNVDLTSVGAYLLYDVDNNKIPLAKYTAQFTIDKETTLKQLDIQINPNNTIEKEFELMIYAGTEEKSYEPYGLMPSLDYPSEIEVTKIQNINKTKKNIAFLNNISTDNGYINAANASIAKVIANQNYTISFYCSPEHSGSQNIQVRNVYSNSTYEVLGNIKYLSGNRVSLSFIPKYNGKVYLSANLGSAYTNVLSDLQIEYGNEATDFESYQGNEYNVELPEGEFNNSLGTYSNYISKINNKWCLVKYMKEIILNGTENVLNSSNGNIFRFLLTDTPISNNITNTKSNAIKSNYFSNESYMNLYYGTVENGIEIYNNHVQFRDDKISTVDDWKSFFAEKYEAGTPVKIYYILVEPEIVELPEETQNTLNSIELMDNLNIISVDNGTLSFEYNKSLYKVLEEKDEEILDLKNQIALNGNYELIKEITSTTEQQEFKFENLKLEKAIIYFEATPSTGETNPGELITTVNNFNNIGVGAGLNVGKYGRYIVRIDKLTNNIYKVRSDFNINTDSVFANTTQSRENFNLIQASEINEIKIKHWNAGTGVGTKVTLYGVRIPGSDVQALSEVTEENVIEENINYDQEIISDINTSESEVLEDE